MRRTPRTGRTPALAPLGRRCAAFALLVLGGCGFGEAAIGTAKPDLYQPPAPPDLWQPPPPPDLWQPDMTKPPPQPPPDMARPPEPPVGAGFVDPNLAARTIDYGLALRSASLKLVGDLPTSDEVAQLDTLIAGNDPVALDKYYQKRLDAYLADPRFSKIMVSFFRNQFRAGGASPGGSLPNMDTAAAFAAQVVVADRPFTDVVTATTGTCVTFNPANSTFVAANCGNLPNGVVAAGVLTDPGIMSLNISNMAFRRARWVQETFACAHFPSEYRANPVPQGGGIYTNPWDIETVAGRRNGGLIDFQEDATVVCANCHASMNHLAPLFAYFDINGKWQMTVQVSTSGAASKPGDWLSPGNQTPAWRFGVFATDPAQLGKAIAADPVFATCIATRVWDWAMSKNDAIEEQAVPADVLQPVRDAITGSTFKLKAGIRAAFTSPDYLRF